MAESLAAAFAGIRELLLDERLVRAVASGRRRGEESTWRRAELRFVDLKSGPHLQVVRYDETQAFTSNHTPGEAAAAEVDALFAEPFVNWHIECAGQTVQLRVTKKGEAVVSRRGSTSPSGERLQPTGEPPTTSRVHDRQKPRLLPEDDPVLIALGISDANGRVKPSRQAKYRQVEEFLRALDAALSDIRVPRDRPLRIADLGCGNAYLTFAAHRFLTAVRGLTVEMSGIDVKRQSLEHNSSIASQLGIAESLHFVQSPISATALADKPDVVLALHACDTATDDALAAAIEWDSALVLAAPCCHHDIAAQLRHTPAPAPYTLVTRFGILRERFADTLTDALRAAVLRRCGYRVEVSEFVESQHTPRNTLIRAVRAKGGTRDDGVELEELISSWGVHPKLAELVSERLR